jgi:hypothetical protein
VSPSNASAAILATVPRYLTQTSLVQEANAWVLIALTEVGMVTKVREEQE